MTTVSVFQSQSPLRHMRLRDEHQGRGACGHVRQARAGSRGYAGQLQGYGSRRKLCCATRSCAGAAKRRPRLCVEKRVTSNGGDHAGGGGGRDGRLRMAYVVRTSLLLPYGVGVWIETRKWLASATTTDSTRRSTPRLSSETASTAKISIPMPCALHATLLPVSMGVRVTRGRQPRRQRRGWRICDASWGLVLLRLIQCVPRAFRNGAHLQTFRTVVDKVCRDNPPRILCLL